MQNTVLENSYKSCSSQKKNKKKKTDRNVTSFKGLASRLRTIERGYTMTQKGLKSNDWLEPPASWSVLPLHSHAIHLHACVLFRLQRFGSLSMMKSKGRRQQLKGALAAKRGRQKKETFARPASLLAPWRPAETAAPSSDANWGKKPPDLCEDKREIIFFNSCQRGHGSFLSTTLYHILVQPLLCKPLFYICFRRLNL